MTKEIIAEEISRVTLLIQKLIRFKNENRIKMYSRDFTFEVKTFMRTGIRYETNFRKFIVKNGKFVGEDDPIIKKYKSINRLLYDLKIYRKNLQRTYSSIKE